MFLCDVTGAYKDHEKKICLYICDVLFDHLKYRNIHFALKLGNMVACFIDEADIGADGPVAPAIAPTEIQCIVIENLMTPVYLWDALNAVKSKCFDYCEFYSTYHIKGNLGIHVGIITRFHDNDAMRDFADDYGL